MKCPHGVYDASGTGISAYCGLCTPPQPSSENEWDATINRALQACASKIDQSAKDDLRQECYLALLEEANHSDSKRSVAEVCRETITKQLRSLQRVADHEISLEDRGGSPNKPHRKR